MADSEKPKKSRRNKINYMKNNIEILALIYSVFTTNLMGQANYYPHVMRIEELINGNTKSF
jgi:hypothetical protein